MPSRGRQIVGVLVTLLVLLLVFAGLVEGTRSVRRPRLSAAAVVATTAATSPCPRSRTATPARQHRRSRRWPAPRMGHRLPEHEHQGPCLQHDHRDDQAVRHGQHAAQPLLRTGQGHGRQRHVRKRQAVARSQRGRNRTHVHDPDPAQRAPDPAVRQRPAAGRLRKGPQTEHIAGHTYPVPNVIVFKFKTGGPGKYVWHCYVPCGEGLAGEGFSGQEGFGGAMATTGYMAGTVTVS